MPTTNIGNLKGPALPFVRVKGGYSTPKAGLDLAWSAILFVIFTRLGTRIQRPTFGCGIKMHVFDLVPAASTVFAEVIRNALVANIPYINVVDVQVTTNNTTVGFLVTFSMKDDSQVVTNGVLIGKDGSFQFVKRVPEIR